jgi:hypothetical protein
MVAAAKAPSLLLGVRREVGFKISDDTLGDGELGRRLGDNYREVGWGFGHTFPELEVRFMPTPFAMTCIDYIFRSGKGTGRRTRLGARGGPDPRFLVAELSF